jgi:DNA-directed RNA polymerase specialized sigma24 family protein
MPAALSDALTREKLFASTRWTIIRNAAGSQVSSTQSLNALSELCQIYWRPVYLFLRRQGIAQHDAQDLTQGFFADLIENRSYTRADESKGRFRSFLLGALKHFLADAQDFDRALKRGGGTFIAPLDEAAVAEAERQVARTERWSAPDVYDRGWAEALLRQALDRLANECALAGTRPLFEALKPHLSPRDDTAVPYAELSARVGRPAATLRKDVERLRARYGEILREEVCDTVSDQADVDEELRYLRRTLSLG